MTLKMTWAAKNGILDSGFDSLLNNAILEIRSGVRPLNAKDAPTGVLLWSKNPLPADAFAAAVSGVKQKLGTWSANAVATGTAIWFRFKLSTDTGAVTETQVRIDGDITLVGNGGEMTLNDLAVISGVSVEVVTCAVGLN